MHPVSAQLDIGSRRSKITLQGVFCVGRFIPASLSRRYPEHLEPLRVFSHADQGGTRCQRNIQNRQAHTHTHKKTKKQTKKRANKGDRMSTPEAGPPNSAKITHTALLSVLQTDATAGAASSLTPRFATPPSLQQQQCYPQQWRHRQQYHNPLSNATPRH